MYSLSLEKFHLAKEAFSNFAFKVKHKNGEVMLKIDQ